MNPTLAQIIAYINQYINTNGINSITGAENNTALIYLAKAILNYSVNGSLAGISSSTGVVPLSKPITLFSVVPSSVNWPDNVQFEYYIVNATGVNIPITAGYSYVDQYGVSQTTIPARTSIHIAKATNGQWILVDNLGGGGGSGNLPSQTGHQGQSLFTNGTTPLWSDGSLFIPSGDANWINATTWINGSSYTNPYFSSPKFLLFWNDLSRYLLQNVSPVEWQYETNGFQVLIGGFDSATANVILTFKGLNS
jgi:hypothetical protein